MKANGFLLVLAALFIAGACAVPADAWEQQEFIITTFCTPPNEEDRVAAYAAEGYNLTWCGPGTLDLNHKYGVKGLMRNDVLLNPAALDDPEKKAQLDAMIDAVKDHPAMQGYYIIDEPGTSAFPELGRLVAYLKERDPKHYAYINLYPTYASKEQLNVSAEIISQRTGGGSEIFVALAGEPGTQEVVLAYKEYLRQFVEVVKPELLSYDHYHFYKTRDTGQYFLNLELIRECGLDNNLPFLNIIQANTIIASWRLPNKDELRFLVYTTLAYGGRGISYFTYWGPESYNGLYQDGERMPLALDAATLNHEMKVLGPELMKLESTGVYHTLKFPYGTRPIPKDCPVQVEGFAECVLGMFKSKKKTDSFMLTNCNYRAVSEVELTFEKGVRALQEFSRTSGKWENHSKVYEGWPVKVALQPGDGRLFRMKY